MTPEPLSDANHQIQEEQEEYKGPPRILIREEGQGQGQRPQGPRGPQQAKELNVSVQK